MCVIIYPCRDYSDPMLVKGAQYLQQNIVISFQAANKVTDSQLPLYYCFPKTIQHRHNWFVHCFLQKILCILELCSLYVVADNIDLK